jgi:23S rRNA (pseudouridine1915-N3)-methyltransferase
VRYRLAVVGKAARGFHAQAATHYQERLAALAKVETIEVKEGRGASPEETRAKEAAALRGAADGRLIALDERGRSWSSAALAKHVSKLELRGVSRLTLLIGGADGLDPELRAQADERWRLSDLTLPHDLARVLLLEQLYRIETIRTGHPYHRA